jgi:diguanylate cyclase (GGDEF)-like protein/PAS domain S-box-containing protein
MIENSSSTQIKVNQPTWRGALRALWQRLTEPGGELPEAERRRARLLSGFLLVLVLTITAALGLLTLRDPNYLQPNPTLLVTLGVAVALMAGYGLNRAGRVRVAMRLTVATISLATWAIIIANQEAKEIVLGVFPYLIVSVLFSSVLLSLRSTSLLMLAHLAAGVLLPGFAPHLAVSEYVDNLILVGIISVLIVAAAVLRRQDLQQIERQTEALTESESRFRSAFGSAAIGMALVGLDGRWLQVNLPLCELVGYSEAELLTTTFQAITHPDDLEADLNHVRQLLAGEIRSYHMEKRYFHKRGHVVWILLSVSLMRGAQGQPSYFISQIQDITARKQAEAALQEAEAKLRALFEVLPVGVSILDDQRRMVDANPALEKVVSMSKKDLMEGAYKRRKYLHPNGKPMRPEEFPSARAFKEQKAVLEAEVGVVTEQGETIWTSVSAVPIPVANLGVVVVTTDITARKRTEAELRALFAAMEDVVIVFDANGRYLQIAPTNPASLYRPAHEMLGKTLSEVLPPPQAELLHQHIRRALKERQTIHAEYSLPMRGAEVWRDAVVSPLSGDTVLWVGRDITARKRAEETLQEANLKLTRGLAELEQRTREIALLNEMSDLLQVCNAAEEAYAIIARLMRQFFPAEAGALYVISASRNVVETAAAWGLSPARAEQRAFAPDDCWALRRGQPHVVEETRIGLLCPHLADPPPATYLCVPMMAQGEALGVLYLQSQDGPSPEPAGPLLIDTKQQLAQTVADSIALALANLKLRETLRNQSIRDPLTGLFNRRYMEETLERELRRVTRLQRSLGIIMLDVDHFKRFNDTFGHDAGDALLRELSSFLKAHIRGEDVACRYGGEEFTLILPEASLEVTRDRAEHLRVDIQHLHVEHEGQPLGNVTLSFGVALFPAHGPTREAVLQAADAALYRAKREGRDRVIVAE